MVNEAYLNRLNGKLPVASARREVNQVDRLDPLGLRIDHQRADRERDAVGDSALLVVQAEQPGLAREQRGQGPLPEQHSWEAKSGRKQRVIEQVVKEMVESE